MREQLRPRSVPCRSVIGRGPGWALVLDMVAAMLSGGFATWQISTEPVRETELSQVFIAINLAAVGTVEANGQIASRIVDHLQSLEPGSVVRYPGEQVLKTRARNLAEGIPVEAALWQEAEHHAELGPKSQSEAWGTRAGDAICMHGKNSLYSEKPWLRKRPFISRRSAAR